MPTKKVTAFQRNDCASLGLKGDYRLSLFPSNRSSEKRRERVTFWELYLSISKENSDSLYITAKFDFRGGVFTIISVVAVNVKLIFCYEISENISLLL